MEMQRIGEKFASGNFVGPINHFSLANMVGRTARTLPLAAVSGGRAHRGWQAQCDLKENRGWQAQRDLKENRGWQARVT